MGQNISNINIDGMAGKTVNAYTNGKVSGAVDASSSSNDNSSNYIYDGAPSKQTKVNKTMDEFEEYLKNQQEKAKENGEDAESQEKADKEAAKELRNNLSSEELKKLTMMGVDVESARLSDIMGMVNTMRGKAHREETQELFAQIKANSGDVDNLMVTGDGIKVAGTDVSVDNVSVADYAQDKNNEVKDGVSAQNVYVKNTGSADVPGTEGAEVADTDEAGKETTSTKADITNDGEKVSGFLSASGTQADKKNDISEAEDFTPGKNELVYMVKNNLPLNKENLYKAHFSGIKAADGVMDDDTFGEVSAQIAGIIEDTGIENFDMQDARFLLDNDLPVNADSIRLVSQYKQLENTPVNIADIPENDAESVQQAAQQLYNKVLFLEPEVVQEVAEQLSDEGKEVSVQAAYAYQLENTLPKNDTEKSETKTDKKIDKKADEKTAKKTDSRKVESYSRTVSKDTESIKNTENLESLESLYKNANDDGVTDTSAITEGMTAAGITAKKQLVEIQLSMTLQVANRMAKLDINVDTKGLSETLDILKKAERELLKESLANSGVEPTDENADMLSETIAGVEKLGAADASVYVTALDGGTFTIRGLDAAADVVEGSSVEDAARTENLKRSFETVKRSYEAVGTAPRSDMGDSITKAFANIDELLGELDIDVNYESQRAAKILGYNNLEINQENIDSIIGYDREVNRLMDNFYPEAVMGLIKDGINPMDVSIDELNDIIAQKNYNGGVTDAKNFATYLRDVEKRGEITDEERESYIGIYRVMDKLAKSGDREAGYIFANQANLTIRNMIGAMRSRKAKGMKVDIDDSFGMLDSIETSGSRMDAQIEAGFNGASAGGAENDAVEDEIIQQLERYRQLGANVENFIQENGIEYNISNAFAVDALLNEDEGVYKLVYEAMKKLNFDDESEENLIDHETGNMAASMSGRDVDIDPAEALETEQLLRQLGENGDLSLTYEDIENQLTEFMYDAGAAGTITSLDISAIKSATAGVRLMGSMAKKDRYQIPVETENGTTVVNITIKNSTTGAYGDGTDEPTMIESYMKTENMGNITARISIATNGDGGFSVTGELVSDVSQGNEILQNMPEIKDDFNQRLEESFGAGMVSSDVTFGAVNAAHSEDTNTQRFSSRAERMTASARKDAKGGKVTHATACRAAVDIVRTMMAVPSKNSSNF
jgi:hypothetical protein